MSGAIFDKYENKKFTIGEYVTKQLDGQDYERGELETISATANKCVSYLAKLTALLEKNGTLTVAQVKKISDEAYWEY